MSAALAGGMGLCAAWLWSLAWPSVHPNPALGPEEVIRTVIGALQKYNSPTPNAGIFTAYQFASPENRANTGPYGTFIRLVKLPEFAPLLVGRAEGFGPLSVMGERAEQTVAFRMERGRTFRFRFVVSRQSGEQTQDRCKGCWMVDEVSPITSR